MPDTSTSVRVAWAKRLRSAKCRALRATASAFKVFGALELHCDIEGYCWPLVSTLRAMTGIKKPHTIFAAIKELEAIGILHHKKLKSRIVGKNAPSLYRVGGNKVDVVPRRASHKYVLAAEKSEYPLIPPGPGPSATRTHLADHWTDMPPNGSTPPAAKRHTELSIKSELNHAVTKVMGGIIGFALTPRTEDEDHSPIAEDLPSNTQSETVPSSFATLRIQKLRKTAKTILLEGGHDPDFVEIALSRVADLANAKRSTPRSVAYFVRSVENALTDPDERAAITSILEQRAKDGTRSYLPLTAMEKHNASKIQLVHEVVEQAARDGRPTSEVLAERLCQEAQRVGATSHRDFAAVPP